MRAWFVIPPATIYGARDWMRRDRPDVITELGNKELVFWFWLVLMINNSDSISPIRLSRGPGQLPGAWCCSVCSVGCSAEQHPGPRPESQVTPACSGWCVQCCSGPGVCSLQHSHRPLTVLQAGMKTGDQEDRTEGRWEMDQPAHLKHWNTLILMSGSAPSAVTGHWAAPLGCRRAGGWRLETRRRRINLHTFETVNHIEILKSGLWCCLLSLGKWGFWGFLIWILLAAALPACCRLPSGPHCRPGFSPDILYLKHKVQTESGLGKKETISVCI